MIATMCQTPGAQYHTHVRPGRVEIAVDLPVTLALSEATAGELEARMHNVLELVLAPFFVGGTIPGEPLPRHPLRR